MKLSDQWRSSPHCFLDEKCLAMSVTHVTGTQGSADVAVCSQVNATNQPPVFPPKSLESPYPRLLHERDVIRYQDAEGQFVRVGSGAYADVTLGELSGSGVHVVIKSFRNSPFLEILKEIRMHRYAEHLGVTPRLIGLLPAGPLAGNISLVYEYVPFSKALGDWLDEYKTLTTVQWISVCRQITLALLRLHQHDVLFNDLHRGNVLIQKQANNLKVYLIDFGFATYKNGKIYSPSCGNFSGYNFIAPELVNRFPSTNASDVFALGYVFHSIASTINFIPLLFLAYWCMAQESFDRPQLLPIIAKLDGILFGVRLMSMKNLSHGNIEYNHSTTSTANIDYLILTKEKLAVVSAYYLFCPATFKESFSDKEETSEWAWLLRNRRLLFPKCRVPLFVLDEHDLVEQHVDDIRWMSRATHDAIRVAQLKLANQTVVVKEFYEVPFERVRNEACMTAFLGAIDVSPKIIGILIEYKNMNDIAIVQEAFGNGVSLAMFISLTSGHEWDLDVLDKAAVGEMGHDLRHNASNTCPWSALQFFLGLVKDVSVKTCKVKSHRHLIMERISTLLIQKMISVHDYGYLINNYRTNNILIKPSTFNGDTFGVDIRLIDLRLISSIHYGLYFNRSSADVLGLTHLAPEVLHGEKTTRSSDIYSLCFVLDQIMSDYFLIAASWLASVRTSGTVNNLFNVYSNSTLEEIKHGPQSQDMKFQLSEAEFQATDTAILKYQYLLLKCLYSRAQERPHIQDLLFVSSLAFS